MDASAEILIVDDDSQILILMAKFLRANGFRAHTARNGIEMAETLKRVSGWRRLNRVWDAVVSST